MTNQPMKSDRQTSVLDAAKSFFTSSHADNGLHEPSQGPQQEQVPACSVHADDYHPCLATMRSVPALSRFGGLLPPN